MKKILLLLSVMAIMVSCNKTDNEYTITGTATGFENGQKIILQTADSVAIGKMNPIDTIKVENGKFEFKGVAGEPEVSGLLIEGKGNIDLILEGGTIAVALDKDTIRNSKVTGTYNNDELTQYKKDIAVTQKQIQSKAMAFQQANMKKFQDAQAAKDTVVINALVKENQAIMKPMGDQNYTYAESHPKAFLSVILVEGFLYSPDPDFARIKKIYNSFTSELKNTRHGKVIKQKLDAHDSVEVGKIAPDFSAKSPEGKTISLKEAKGKVTIVDFWASWCVPCREENPNVVALYNEFHDKGLNIIGISLDNPKDDAKWKAAIAQDKLTWTQISNLQGWQDPIVKKYNVTAIPATFLLDASGKIVAKNLQGEELKAKVKELLGA
ncbi:redoxin domain-containing protein [Flavobacterium qiangtangense]|uniref:Redoxin domain-containing protein n=1 Tax=Flavobacterium qiangtangense TaxID=1442595 RepID=A0ABW1PJZ4_9FLAO